MTDTNDRQRQSSSDSGATGSERTYDPEVHAQISACQAILKLFAVEEFRQALVIHKDQARQIAEGKITSVAALKKSITRRLYSLRNPDSDSQEPPVQEPGPSSAPVAKQEEEPWD